MNSNTYPNKLTRLEWIDWIKTFGIYLIILGHFFSIGEKYVYVFSVPLFFLISGFLCKKEKDNSVFWRKLWYNLIVPMLIITTANFVCYYSISLVDGTFKLYNIVLFLRNLIIGLHGGMELGVGVCWFIYTLVILKIIYQYSPNNFITYLWGGVFLGMAYVYNHLDFSEIFSYKLSNSIVNVCTAYPFFAIGAYAKKYKNRLNAFNNMKVLGFVFLVCTYIVYLCGYYNEHIWMDCCDYGSNMFLFLLGAIAGIICVFVLSKCIGRAPKAVTIISRGTIIILGFHLYFVILIRRLFDVSLLDYIFAAIILVAFIPIIQFVGKKCPLMIGKYRTK